MARTNTRGSVSGDIWPGFVDALATLLLVIIFLLVVFVLAQVFLSQAISGKDEALNRLTRQVDELADLLSLERQANADLRLNIAQLSSSLQSTVSARDDLILQLRQLSERAEIAESALAKARETNRVERDALTARLADLERLKRDVSALRQLRADLEAQVAQLAGALESSRQALSDSQREAAARAQEVALGQQALLRAEALLQQNNSDLEVARKRLEDRETALKTLQALLAEREGELDRTKTDLALRDTSIETMKKELEEQAAALAARLALVGELRDRTKALEARLADQRERTLLAQSEIEKRDVSLRELQARLLAQNSDLSAEKSQNQRQKELVAALNAQILALRAELLEIGAKLDASEAKDEASKATIADLGRRLNRALASKVQELSRYRSEFFGRLREVLGNREDITVVGDRFVFQSEVLFESGSAGLEISGMEQLADLAFALIQIAEQIPPEINWVLRVDGHTDSRPIQTFRFPSNWELSTARAISVVRFLEGQGVPPHRLAATGFGSHQPLVEGSSDAALRLNRRIELKLTQR